MLDISYCTNNECKRKETCKRHFVPKEILMASFVHIADSENCTIYWPLAPYKERRKTRKQRVKKQSQKPNYDTEFIGEIDDEQQQ